MADFQKLRRMAASIQISGKQILMNESGLSLLAHCASDIGGMIQGLQQVSEEIEHIQWLVNHHEERHVPEVRRVIDRVYEVLVANNDTRHV